MMIMAGLWHMGKRPAPVSMRPKPTQTFIKKKPISYTAQRVVKPEPKSVGKEAKVLKDDTKKQEVKKETKSQETSEVTSGHYELNTLMTRMVEAELRDLMNTIWKELPGAPSTELECLVVDTLRNKAGDDLRHVLGLNITKRLLNVFNPLCVKVKFSGKPEKEELREFLKKYSFVAFARKAVNIFAARVKTIDDFDRLCSDTDVRCGSVKVSITPVYSFLACPKNLKTNYKDISSEVVDTVSIYKDIELGDISSKAENAKVECNESIKPINKNPTNPIQKVPATDKEVSKQEEIKVVNTKVNTPVKNNEVQSTPNENITKKLEAPKTVPTIDKSDNKTHSETNAMQQNSTKAPSTKVTPTKVIPTNPTPTKVTPTNSTPTKVATTNPAPAKVTPTNPAPTKVVSTSKVATPKLVKKKATPKKPAKVEDDYDELDDRDILALMSEGIVLDECSGSEEE